MSIDNQPEIEQQKKNRGNNIVIGVNVAIMLIYTIYLTQDSTDGILFSSLLALFHMFLCLIACIFVYRKGFLISAGLIILIGLSTCYFVIS